jgi:hypothetical protein
MVARATARARPAMAPGARFLEGMGVGELELEEELELELEEVPEGLGSGGGSVGVLVVYREREEGGDGVGKGRERREGEGDGRGDGVWKGGDTHDAEPDPASLVELTVAEGQCVNELLFATMLSLVIVSRVKMLRRGA